MKSSKISAAPDQAEAQRRSNAAIDIFNMLDLEIPDGLSDEKVEKIAKKVSGIIWRLIDRKLEIHAFVREIKNFRGATSIYFS